MITIKCTEKEYQALKEPRNMVTCYIMNALGYCREDKCLECRQNQDQDNIIKWEIIKEV